MNFIKRVFIFTSSTFFLIMFFNLLFYFKEHRSITPFLVLAVTFSCGYLWGWDNREKKFDKDLKKELDNFDKIRSSK